MDSNQQCLLDIEENKALKRRNRKKHNQYFTPEFAVEKALSLIPIKEVKNIIDPAAGNGIFLKVASRKWNDAKLFGVDIDPSVVQGFINVNLPNCTCFTGNSLLKGTLERTKTGKVIAHGGFDLVMGNPPFSSWFHRIESSKILSGYKLAHRNGVLMKSQAIEILFLEIFIKLARVGGYIVIVLPDGVLSNPQYRYVREFILAETKCKYVLSLHRNVFEGTSAKTSILLLEKKRTCKADYLTAICHLEKTGNSNDAIRIKDKDLSDRMDYFYYSNLKTSSINELAGANLKFVPLKDLTVYCKTGKTLYGKEREFSEKGLRFLHATNITDIGINYEKDERFINPFGKMNFPSAYTKTGDVLLVRVGVGCAGRAAIIDVKEDEGAATDYIHIFRVKNISPYFIVVYLKTKFGRESINLLKHGVGTVSINKTGLLSLPIPLVHENIQLEIEERYKRILVKYRKSKKDNALRNELTSLINCLEEEITCCGRKKYVEVRSM